MEARNRQVFVERSILIEGGLGEGDTGFATIAAAVKSPIVRRVMAYWSTLPPESPPKRALFDPIALGPALSHIFLAEKRDDGDYLFRVSGSFVVMTAGFDATMRLLSDCEAMTGRAEVRRIYDAVLSAGTPRLDFMRVPWRDREWLPVERLLLPLLSDEGEPRFLVGVSDHWTEML